jgi:hypothetical protein
MKNISTAQLHGRSYLLVAFPMGQGQISDEFPAEEADLSVRNRDVPRGQFFNDLSVAATVNKQGVAHMDNDIISKRASLRRKRLQILASVNRSISRRLQHGLFGLQWSDIQRHDLLPACLQYCEVPGAKIPLRRKVNCGDLGKQPAYRNSRHNPINMALEATDHFVSGIFFSKS